MNTKSVALSLAVASVVLASCAGREPNLVQIVRPTDNQMDCAQITAEITYNNERIQDLANEEGWKVAQNVAAGVGGVVIPVLWFGMDFQDAAGKEAKALSQRNQYLSTLAGHRCK